MSLASRPPAWVCRTLMVGLSRAAHQCRPFIVQCLHDLLREELNSGSRCDMLRSAFLRVRAL